MKVLCLAAALFFFAAPLRAAVDPAEEIGRLARVSSSQEDRLAALRGTLLLKLDDAADSLSALAEERLTARISARHADEMAAIGVAPEGERDARTKALTRKVLVELRPDLTRELLARMRSAVTGFFRDAEKILTPGQRPKIRKFKTRYLSAWEKIAVVQARKAVKTLTPGA